EPLFVAVESLFPIREELLHVWIELLPQLPHAAAHCRCVRPNIAKCFAEFLPILFDGHLFSRSPSAPRSVKPVNAVRGSHYCDTVGAKRDFQIQLSCPLAEQALAASIAAGQRVAALGH